MSAKTLEVFGETIQVRSDVSEFALMEFADIASGETTDLEAMAGMYRLLRECVVQKDWSRFRRAAIAQRAKVDDLMAVITAAFEESTGRPTGRSSDSSDGPTATAPRSTAASLPLVAARAATSNDNPWEQMPWERMTPTEKLVGLGDWAQSLAAQIEQDEGPAVS